jgi:hypothetical protein
MCGTYLRLGVHVHASRREVARAAANKLASQARRDPSKRDRRKAPIARCSAIIARRRRSSKHSVFEPRLLIPPQKPGPSAGFFNFGETTIADYFTPTVIQPVIPNADMTPLERLILGQVFEAEIDGDGVYFFTSIGPSDSFELEASALREAIDASSGFQSTASDYVSERLASLAVDGETIEIDLSGMSWEFIFQDIVRRSETLDYVTAVSAFTCSRMRPDGFGGMAVVITAYSVRGKSTNDILEDFLSSSGDAPSDGGAHVLLRLSEAAVAEQVAVAIESDPDLTTVAASDVTADDIHVAWLAVVDHSDLAEERGATEFRAAIQAIRAAERRQADHT